MSTAALDAVMRQMEGEGLFRRAAAGDQRGASLFVRLAAYRVNPSGDPNSWGWLSKSGGETNVDGYAEDALVLGAAPSNLTNVYDLVGGAGAPGARVLYGAGPVQRRPSNVWVKPVPLSAEEMAYIGATGVEPQPGGGTQPQPVPCGYDAGAIAKLTSAVVALVNKQAHADAERAELLAEIKQLNARLTEEWAARVWTATDPKKPLPTLEAPDYEGRARVFGQSVTFTLTPKR